MADAWHDPSFAREWDQAALVTNPSRADHLDMLVTLIAQLYQSGTAIVDLGMGSGLVEELIFARRPDATVIGIESSQAMIDLAQARLAPFADRYRIVQRDLVELQEGLALGEPSALMLSVQVFHHFPHAVQRALYRAIGDALATGGVFLMNDRLALDAEHLGEIYRIEWERLEESRAERSGWSGAYFLERLQHKEDYPATLEQHLVWLREAGFAATCLHLHLDRALLVGVKTANA